MFRILCYIQVSSVRLNFLFKKGVFYPEAISSIILVLNNKLYVTMAHVQIYSKKRT